MSAFDIHPEHLIDAARRGHASPAQRAELEAHIRVCEECAAEQRLIEAFADETKGAGANSGGLSAVAIDHMLERLADEGRVIAVNRSRPRAVWLPWAAAACLFFTGSAAAAALIAALHADRATAPAGAPRVASTDSPVRPHPSSGKARPAALIAPVDAVAPDRIVTETNAHRAAEVPLTRANKTSERSISDTRSTTSAGELFERARAAHLAGEVTLAVKLYRLLEQRYASSLEAHVSWVVLGRLYLERLDDPRAALACFDRYLEKSGPNRPEALIGRARSLRALGRTQDEVKTLRRLVEQYPDSFYATPEQLPSSHDVR